MLPNFNPLTFFHDYFGNINTKQITRRVLFYTQSPYGNTIFKFKLLGAEENTNLQLLVHR